MPSEEGPELGSLQTDSKARGWLQATEGCRLTYTIEDARRWVRTADQLGAPVRGQKNPGNCAVCGDWVVFPFRDGPGYICPDCKQ
jgi:hypothetical protein